MSTASSPKVANCNCWDYGSHLLLTIVINIYLLFFRFDPDTGLLTGTNDGTLVNLFLRQFGRMTEKRLCVYLLVFQVNYFSCAYNLQIPRHVILSLNRQMSII